MLSSSGRMVASCPAAKRSVSPRAQEPMSSCLSKVSDSSLPVAWPRFRLPGLVLSFSAAAYRRSAQRLFPPRISLPPPKGPAAGLRVPPRGPGLPQSPSFPGPHSGPAGVWVTRYRGRNRVPRCGTCCRQILNALSFLLQGRRIEKETEEFCFPVPYITQTIGSQEMAAATLQISI